MNEEEKQVNTNNIEDSGNDFKKKPAAVAHYYGDIIRKLFFVGSIVILVTFPFFYSVLVYSGVAILGGAILLILLAGLTSPKQKLIVFFNSVISFVSVIFFEYHSIQFYAGEGDDFIKFFLFVISYFLSIIFLFAFYFSVKTLRGMFSK